jgi:Uma2 family endonuclease
MSTHASPETETARGGAGNRPDGMPIIAVDVPVMYEDEGQEEMGDSEIHSITLAILYMALRAHLARRPEYRIFTDLNLYYHRADHWAYVSPDVMVVSPTRAFAGPLTSYRIGEDGPAPILVIEVLSRRSFQQQDLSNKPIIYADLGVAEYILVDPTGEFLPQKLQIRHLEPDRTWANTQDGDGGVTSDLGFRLIIEPDGHVRVIDSKTKKRYLRPPEAQADVDALRKTSEAQQERIRELEAELSRLRRQPPEE